ncbi:glycine C-acetyltransferase [Candidatus Amarolinea dominans]|uniref:glycine C-acetyltransferase n=1 Tax=Candidatus Amarolinea dominans TaxID=3140696 RepID=UPI001E1A913C|nr:glycine C-acetyltransferase [Anaerolineae bacterium]MBK7203810.1 glycine C-acetyltransferase [Anaerolineae bacterium]
MAEQLAWIAEEVASLERQGLLINLRTIGSAVGPWMVVDGQRVLNMCTNDYLGLANHAALRQAAQAAIAEWGVGPAAVRSIAGTTALHVQLEKRLAQFKGVEDALYVQSGFCANQAVIAPLVGKEDVIFSDRLNHASIIDGCRLSGAKIVPYAHGDAADAERVIQENLPNFRRGLLISDGVFSMDGDIAPLADLYAVAARQGVMTMVDDAHGEGVLGRGGRGIVDHFGLHGRLDVEVGTLSKAFGVVGGVIAGKKTVIDFVRQKARPFLFSSAVTPADTAACLAAVDLLEQSTELVDRLWSNARFFKAEMQRLGFDTGRSQTPITPVMLGEAPLAQQFSRTLFAHGLFAMAIGFPTVARGQARIRVMISASHSQADLAQALDIFGTVGKQLGVI